MPKQTFDSSIVLWENEDGVLTGYLKITPELLEELIHAYDDNAPGVVDSYDKTKAVLRMYIAPNESDRGAHMLGSVKINYDREEKVQSKKKRPRAKAVVQPDDDIYIVPW